MPNLRGKTWTETTPAKTEDANFWESHLIDDESYEGLQDLLEGGAGGGHVIVNGAGTDMPQQPKLQFVNATVTNGNGVTIVTGNGEKGDAATVTVGTTTTGAAGTNASVTNSGTTSAAVFDFVIPRGTDGNGIVSIIKTGTSGLVDTYTITFTNGTTTTFTVTNGQNGSGAGDMLKSVYDTNDNGIVDNAERVDGYTVARNVLAGEYTNTQIDNKVSAVLPSTGTTGQYLQKTASGSQWADVEALPAGGTAGQVLTKTGTGADWADPAGGGEWGSITGTLSDQTDLQTALNAKLDTPVNYTVTLSSASWVNGVYTVSNLLITATNNVMLTYPVSMSSSDYDILRSADIRCTAQASGSIELTALGTVPTSDLTIVITIWG